MLCMPIILYMKIWIYVYLCSLHALAYAYYLCKYAYAYVRKCVYVCI